MKISTSPAPLAEQKKDALVVFFQGQEVLLPAGNTALEKLAAEYAKNSAFKGEAGQVGIFPLQNKAAAKQLILAGIGEAKGFHNALLEQAAAAAIRAGRAAGLKSFAMASAIKLKGVSQSDYLLLAGRGAGWGTYEFSTFKSGSKKKAAPSLVFAGAVKDRTAVKAAEAQGEIGRAHV